MRTSVHPSSFYMQGKQLHLLTIITVQSWHAIMLIADSNITLWRDMV